MIDENLFSLFVCGYCCFFFRLVYVLTVDLTKVKKCSNDKTYNLNKLHGLVKTFALTMLSADVTNAQS